MMHGRRILRSLFPFAFSFALAALLLLAFAPGSRAVALRSFFLGPFRNTYSLGNMLGAATGIAFSGLGAALAFRAGVVNLGGEGYIYLGAVAGYIAASSSASMPPWLAVIAAAACAFSSAALVGSAPSLLRRSRGWDELISSFLLAQAIIPFLDWLVSSPLRDPSSQILATAALPRQLRPPRILPPSVLDPSVYLVLAACLAAYLALQRSYWGFRQRMTGEAPDFASAIGFNVGAERAIALTIGSGLMGLGGFLAMLGAQGRVIRSFSSGLGWSGLACAIVAGSNPLLVPPAALFLAYLEAGATQAQLSAGIPPELAGMLQAALFFLAASSRLLGSGGKRRA